MLHFIRDVTNFLASALGTACSESYTQVTGHAYPWAL